MKTAVILAAGKGSKIWPYAEIRSKAMIPVANKPIIAYTIETLIALDFTKIIIVTGQFKEEINHYFSKNDKVHVISDDKIRGTASSLMLAKAYIEDDDFVVFYGDVIVEKEDIKQFIQSSKDCSCTALVSKATESSSSFIGCTVEDLTIKNIYGHSREESTHFFCGFIFNQTFFDVLMYNSGRFTNTEVGMMSPIEGYLEMSLVDYMNDGQMIDATITQKEAYDIDKPWHILEANKSVNTKICNSIYDNRLSSGAKIDPTASINGKVILGENSVIGKNVIIEGNIIVGDHTIIENGAILKGNNVIGHNSYIGNYCYIEEGSTIGNDCVVSHCAELSGIIMNKVYLYHYLEFYGIIGENTDIGAATVCGTLRFDDGMTPHRIRGRKEIPRTYSDATYLGDYCRTGVNAIIMPGCKIGVYSIIGSGVILQEDVSNNTLIYTEQKLIKKQWGPEKYGW